MYLISLPLGSSDAVNCPGYVEGSVMTVHVLMWVGHRHISLWVPITM